MNEESSIDKFFIYDTIADGDVERMRQLIKDNIITEDVLLSEVETDILGVICLDLYRNDKFEMLQFLFEDGNLRKMMKEKVDVYMYTALKVPYILFDEEMHKMKDVIMDEGISYLEYMDLILLNENLKEEVEKFLIKLNK